MARLRAAVSPRRRAQEQSGFNELKKYMHESNGTLETLSAIFRERALVASEHSKRLAALAAKAEQAATGLVGSTAAMWTEVIKEIHFESKYQGHIAGKLVEEIADPMLNFRKDQKKARKPIEDMVDNSAKTLEGMKKVEKEAKMKAVEKVKQLEEQWENYDRARQVRSPLAARAQLPRGRCRLTPRAAPSGGGGCRARRARRTRRRS